MSGKKRDNVNISQYCCYYCCYLSSSQVWRLSAGSVEQFEDHLMRSRAQRSAEDSEETIGGQRLSVASIPLFLSLSKGCTASF